MSVIQIASTHTYTSRVNIECLALICMDGCLLICLLASLPYRMNKCNGSFVGFAKESISAQKTLCDVSCIMQLRRTRLLCSLSSCTSATVQYSTSSSPSTKRLPDVSAAGSKCSIVSGAQPIDCFDKGTLLLPLYLTDVCAVPRSIVECVCVCCTSSREGVVSSSFLCKPTSQVQQGSLRLPSRL
jgi:hypothetical protein